jgi:hypothetical protein
MIFLKKLFILIIIILFLIIISKLLIVRMDIKQDIENFSIISSIENNEISNNKSNTTVSIKNVNSNLYNFPLRELCIKSSFNSSCSGSYINLDMLKYVINRGVRYLDFEVFFIPSNSNNSDNSDIFIPVVATSVDPTYMILDTENSILLDNVLSSVVSNAFTSPCPNYNDPIFINLRIKSNNTEVYAAVASSIDNSIQSKIYNDPKIQVYTTSTKTINPAITITKDTLLSNILGKVIISIDKTINLNYENFSSTCNSYTTNSCYDLKNYINIENGSQDMNLNIYSLVTRLPILHIDNNNTNTNVSTITCINPDNLYLTTISNSNPNYQDYILKYGGCQIVPYRFYQNDLNLSDYENFFNNNNSAFVPLSNAITYYMKNYQ